MTKLIVVICYTYIVIQQYVFMHPLLILFHFESNSVGREKVDIQKTYFFKISYLFNTGMDTLMAELKQIGFRICSGSLFSPNYLALLKKSFLSNFL